MIEEGPEYVFRDLHTVLGGGADLVDGGDILFEEGTFVPGEFRVETDIRYEAVWNLRTEGDSVKASREFVVVDVLRDTAEFLRSFLSVRAHSNG